MLSFALNSRRSHATSGWTQARRAIRRASAATATISATPSGSGSLGSASMPRARTSLLRATAAARQPSQWVRLPTTPAGHRGSRLGPGRIGAGGCPRRRRARRAQSRTAANSARRLGTALATTALSSGKRTPAGASCGVCSTSTAVGSRSLNPPVIVPAPMISSSALSALCQRTTCRAQPRTAILRLPVVIRAEKIITDIDRFLRFRLSRVGRLVPGPAGCPALERP